MFGRSVLLVLTVLVAAGIVLLVLRHPRVSAALHAGSRLFVASIGSFVTFSVDTSTTTSGPFTTLADIVPLRRWRGSDAR